MKQHTEKLPCPYCGKTQTYDEANAKNDYMTRCIECGKRITWSLPFLPPGPPYWAKAVLIDDQTGRVIGYDET